MEIAIDPPALPRRPTPTRLRGSHAARNADATPTRTPNGERADVSPEATRDDRILGNLPFVVHLAVQLRGRGLEIDELTSAGTIGLIEAADRFDSSRGVKFTSYAVWWIRKSMLEALARETRVVRIPGPKYRELRREHPERLGEEVPFDSEFDDGARPDLLAVCRITRTAEHAALDAERLRVLTNELGLALCTREQYVLLHRFGLGTGTALTLETIAARMSLSRERVRQIELQALAKLRKRVGRRMSRSLRSRRRSPARRDDA